MWFYCPSSLLTNDKKEAIRFIAEHNQVIFKGGSSKKKAIVSLYKPSLEEQLQWLIPRFSFKKMFTERISGSVPNLLRKN